MRGNEMGMKGVWLAKPFLLIPIATMWMDCEITGLLEGEILGDLDVSQPQIDYCQLFTLTRLVERHSFIHCIDSVSLNHSKSQSDQLQIIIAPSAYQICIAQYYLHKVCFLPLHQVTLTLAVCN